MNQTRHYYEGTGVLNLTATTPVIRALFEPYNLNKATAAPGKTTIAIHRKFYNPTWSDIFMNLSTLATTLGYQSQLGKNTHTSPINCLSFLTQYFNIESLDTDYLHIFCEEYEPDMQPPLEELFELASHFNDGHHLEYIIFSGVHHCTEPELGSFHGECVFISKEIVRYLSTRHICDYMDEIMVKTNDLNHVYVGLFCELNDMLNSFQDENLRQTIQRKLIAALKNPGEFFQKIIDTE